MKNDDDDDDDIKQAIATAEQGGKGKVRENL